MRYLGIDYGTKKIGIAVSDDGGTLAFPHSVIDAGPGAPAAIAALVKESGTQTIIVGESRDFSGEKNPVMKDVERFVKDIGELSAVPVLFEREFFTSALAARQFAPEEKSRKANPSHEKLDAAAAALILQSFLDRKK